jgi:hypothetical protein
MVCKADNCKDPISFRSNSEYCSWHWRLLQKYWILKHKITKLESQLDQLRGEEARMRLVLKIEWDR